MINVYSILAATFFIPPGQGAAFFVETCESEVTNPITSTVQYCFSDLVFAQLHADWRHYLSWHNKYPQGIATLQNANLCNNLEAVSSGTFAGNTFFVGYILFLKGSTPRCWQFLIEFFLPEATIQDSERVEMCPWSHDSRNTGRFMYSTFVCITKLGNLG